MLASVGAAVLLIAGVSAWRDSRRDAGLEADRLSGSAALLASLSVDAALHDNSAAGFSVLRSITLMPGVIYARLERANGSMLAETGSGARLIGDARVSAGGRGSTLSLLRSATIEASAPVRYGGRVLGRVMVVGRAANGWANLAGSLLVTFLAALAATGVGLAIAWRMQTRISAPLVGLTSAMARVQESHDYSQTVEMEADDEVGQLLDGFNSMLREIRSRDESIDRHLSGLEQTVASRTSDLLEATQAAEAANSAKSDFLATMSHEIRTPMNGIMVMAEMLAVGELPPRQRRFAEVIAKSGSSLLAIINDILDFSKIEAGKMELEFTPVDLVDVVEDVCALFWERASSKGLDLAAYIDPATPRFIAADPTRLRQVIGNLVNNAIKFTETGGVLVRVDCPEGRIRVAVQDTGIGIAPDKLSTVFGAFTQADQSTTRKFGGTGLGLAICKRLVEAMNSDLTVSSVLGRGSSFGFYLPAEVIEPAASWPSLEPLSKPLAVSLAGVSGRAAVGMYLRAAKAAIGDWADVDRCAGAIADASALKALAAGEGRVCIGEYGDSLPAELVRTRRADVALTQPFRRREIEGVLRQLAAGERLHADTLAAPEESAGAPASFAGRRILVADDSAVNREVAIEALSRLGVACEAVNDGCQAVDAALASRFDLILMDGSMPELDGYGASLELRRRQAELGVERTPIIALTAHVVGPAAEAWRDAQMDSVLHKPFTLSGLALAIGRHLEASEPTVVERPSAPAAPASSEPPVVVVEGQPAPSGLLDPTVTAELQRMAAQGQGDFVKRVRQLYRDNAPEAARKVIDAAMAQDTVAAATAAHALKSMSLNIGASAVAEQAAWIEREAREYGRVRQADSQTLYQRLLATLDVLGDAPPAPTAPLHKDDDAALLADLEHAAARGEFSLVYQPQIARADGAVTGVEVLLRWTHPRRGKVSPALFIPLAERHGKMRPITRWVIEQAMTETADLGDLSVSFNASALEFSDPSFVDELAVLISRHDFSPARLEVEVTETAILSDAEDVRRTMSQLHDMGLRIALDDFGVGYSSLSHLRLFPFDKLKIDRAFVQDCCIDVQSATLVHAVVSIGRALGMKVVAEGVENDVQQKFLKAAGVHAYQGYLFGQPESIADLKRRLDPPRAIRRVS